MGEIFQGMGDNEKGICNTNISMDRERGGKKKPREKSQRGKEKSRRGHYPESQGEKRILLPSYTHLVFSQASLSQYAAHHLPSCSRNKQVSFWFTPQLFPISKFINSTPNYIWICSLFLSIGTPHPTTLRHEHLSSGQLRWLLHLFSPFRSYASHLTPDHSPPGRQNAFMKAQIRSHHSPDSNPPMVSHCTLTKIHTFHHDLHGPTLGLTSSPQHPVSLSPCLLNPVTTAFFLFFEQTNSIPSQGPCLWCSLGLQYSASDLRKAGCCL